MSKKTRRLKKLAKTNEITAAVIVSGVIARKEPEDADPDADQDVSGGKKYKGTKKSNDTKLAEAGIMAQHHVAGKRRPRRSRVRQRR
jgi:hypothetical protein